MQRLSRQRIEAPPQQVRLGTSHSPGDAPTGLGSDGERGYIRRVPIPFWLKVAMWTAFIAGTTAIYVVTSFVFGLLPRSIAAMLGACLVGVLIGYFVRVWQEVTGRMGNRSGT